MEVHPPHHAIHTWRDFFIHMATITLGLLIALGLEAGVESMHHRHQLAEARERIHREIETNRAILKEDQAHIREAIERIRGNINLLDAPGPLDSTKLQFGFFWNEPENSAWDAAHTSGVLSYMPYDELQHYSDIYNQQTSVDAISRDYIASGTQSVSLLMRYGDLSKGPVKANLTPAERTSMAGSAADSLTKVILLREVSQTLADLYDGRK
jgi:hypothetical protein